MPTTDPSQKYYIIPTENLPLLEPLRLIPVIGNPPIADLLQPALKVIVNLGYGNPPNYGWSTDGYANVQSTFGFIPDVNWGGQVAQLFAAGVAQGISDFVADISPGGIMWQELAALHLPKPVPAPVFPAPPTGVISALQTVISDVAYTISSSSAALYAAALPTADIVNAIGTMLPAYDANLFLGGIQQALSGDVITGLVNAVGLPLAATVGLGTTAALIEVLVLLQAVEGGSSARRPTFRYTAIGYSESIVAEAVPGAPYTCAKPTRGGCPAPDARPASPRSWRTSSCICRRPDAPIGSPLAISPPSVLIGSEPWISVAPSASSFSCSPSAHRPVSAMWMISAPASVSCSCAMSMSSGPIPASS